jgi:hypothetical protein
LQSGGLLDSSSYQIDFDGELLAPLTLGPAGIAHREGQTRQVETLVAERIQETIRLFFIQVIDLGDRMGGLLKRLGVRQLLL